MSSQPTRGIKAWYYHGPVDEDIRAPHMGRNPQWVTLDELNRKTGLEYRKFDSETVDTNPEYIALKKERNYDYEDEWESPKEYDAEFFSKFREHVHADDEIRVITGGSAYWDVRDWDDRWIRIEGVKNDLLIIPAGLYHRFDLTPENYIKAKRLFTGSPCWTAYYRPEADDHPARKKHVERLNAAKKLASL